MERLKSFFDFKIDNEKLKEEKYIAECSFTEFKNLMKQKINESQGSYDMITESKLSQLHSMYEMGSLLESKSHWENSSEPIYYLESDDHIILTKNSEAFIIEKKTLEFAQTVNEKSLFGKFWDWWNSWSWRDITPDFIEKYVDKFTGGAKKVWEWLGKAKKAVSAFIHKNHEWIAILLSVASAVFGVIGCFGQPWATVLAGCCMMLNGALHISHGRGLVKKGTEQLRGKNAVAPGMTATILGGLPNFATGIIMVLLGGADIKNGFKSATNPASAVAHAVHGEAHKKTLMESVKEWTVNLGDTLEHHVANFIKWIEALRPDRVKLIFGPLVHGAEVKIAVGALGLMCVFLGRILRVTVGWLWTAALEFFSAFVDIANYVVNIPKKISESIEQFSQMKDKNFAQKIICQGLEQMVKPLTDVAKNWISENVQPSFDDLKSYISGLKESKRIFEEWEKEDKEHHDEAHQTIEKMPKTQEIKGQVILSEENKEPVKMSEEDAKNIADTLKKAEEVKSEESDKKEGDKESSKEIQSQKESLKIKNRKFIKTYEKFSK